MKRNSFYISNIIICNAMDSIDNSNLINTSKHIINYSINVELLKKPSILPSIYDKFLNHAKINKIDENSNEKNSIDNEVHAINLKLLDYTSSIIENECLKKLCNNIKEIENKQIVDYLTFIIVSYFSFKDINVIDEKTKDEFFPKYKKLFNRPTRSDDKIKEEIEDYYAMYNDFMTFSQKKFDINNILFEYFDESEIGVLLMKDPIFKEKYKNFKNEFVGNNNIKNINSFDFNTELMKKLEDGILKDVEPLCKSGEQSSIYKIKNYNTLLMRFKNKTNSIEDIYFFIKYKIDNYKGVKGFMRYYFNFGNKIDIIEYVKGNALEEYEFFDTTIKKLCESKEDRYVNFKIDNIKDCLVKYFNNFNIFFKNFGYYIIDRHEQNILYNENAYGYNFINIDLFYDGARIYRRPYSVFFTKYFYNITDIEFNKYIDVYFNNCKENEDFSFLVATFIDYSRFLNYYDVDFILNYYDDYNLYKYIPKNKNIIDVKNFLLSISNKLSSVKVKINKDRMLSIFSVLIEDNKILLNQNTLANKKIKEITRDTIYNCLLNSFYAYELAYKLKNPFNSEQNADLERFSFIPDDYDLGKFYESLRDIEKQVKLGKCKESDIELKFKQNIINSLTKSELEAFSDYSEGSFACLFYQRTSFLNRNDYMKDIKYMQIKEKKGELNSISEEGEEEGEEEEKKEEESKNKIKKRISNVWDIEDDEENEEDEDEESDE